MSGRIAEHPPLSSFAGSAGCACKLGQFDLSALLSKFPSPRDANVIAGFGQSEDACVYRLPGGQALVETVDFFTPVVDDPHLFGAIAAANALSDLYAVGARPVLALALAAFPAEVLPIDVLEEILRGGAEKAAEAGATVAGGHTIDHDVPIYGLAATGLAAEKDLTRHDAARPGDEIVLTKPLGVGLLVCASRADSRGGALHRRVVGDAVLEKMGSQMAALNAAASALMPEFSVRCSTDVTGFGLLGHAYNMMEASGTTARFRASSVPVLDGAREVARRGIAPGGSRKNFRNMKPRTEGVETISEEDFLLLVDAQTSGGLLVCVPEGRGDDYASRCRQAGAADAAVIGRVEPRGSAPLAVGP